MSAENWLVVRKSRTILGGYRVVKFGLTEDVARRWVASYKTPHEAMPEPKLLDLRLRALGLAQPPSEPSPERMP